MKRFLWFSRRWLKPVVGVVTLLVAAFLLFWNLGHYALWDDEALTALAAKGVLATGDTTALVGEGNLVAYNSGWCLSNLHDRSTPPLPAYVTALSFAVFGESAWSARLPFALMGLATIALMLWWARHEKFRYFLVLAVGILGNVSLFLYFRNARYYAPMIMSATLVAWFYWNWRGGRKGLWGLALASALLFASHYIAYVAVYAALVADWLLWKRREVKMTVGDWLTLALPQVVINGAIALVWNPFYTKFGGQGAVNDVVDRMQLWWWHLRDINASEFLALPVLAAALVFALIRVWRGKGTIAQNIAPWRACVALLVTLTVTVILTPQIREVTRIADVRYIAYLIPLGVALMAWALCVLAPKRLGWTLLLAAILFGTNLFHGGRWLASGFHSTIVSYVKELRQPVPEPYTPMAAWINRHIPKGKTVLVWPPHSVFPLMFHAPKALYAWQLRDNTDPQFSSLAPEHFAGKMMPEYLIAFGPHVAGLFQTLHQYGDGKTTYALLGGLDFYWKDLYRPELFWRTFKPVAGYDKNRDIVYIFKRIEKPPDNTEQGK